MICKVCKQEIDDRLAKCPYCGTVVEKKAEKVAAGRKADNGFNVEDSHHFTGVNAGTKSIFDNDEYADDENVPVEEYDESDEYSNSQKKRYKYIVSGLIVAIVVFAIILVCFLFFGGALGGKNEVTTEEPSTTPPITMATTAPSTAPTTELTTEETTEATTQKPVDYGEGVRRPDYLTLDPVEITVDTDSLRMRKSPTTDEDNIITSLSNGTKLNIYGADSEEDADWYFVRFESEKLYGWVSSAYVKGDDDVSFKSAGSSTPSMTEEVTTVSEPDETDEPEKTTGEEDEEDDVTEEEQTTKQADTTKPSDERSDPAGGVQVPSGREDEKDYTITANSGLKLRKTPDSDTEDNVITVIAKDLTVSVSKIENGWAYVYFGDGDQWGWVSANYITEAD